MAASLQTTFRALCRDYFPRWRANTAWTLVEGPHGTWVDAQGDTHTTSEQGMCDRTTNTIFINHGWTGRPELRALMIHEICHAVTTGAHGKQFCARLRQAAQRASDLGDLPLSIQLREEADGYEHTALRLGSPYGRIPDIVCDNPSVTFEQVLAYLAHEYLETVPALLQRYPRLRTVYDQARRREITTLRFQLKTVRQIEGLKHKMAYLEERLEALEAATVG